MSVSQSPLFPHNLDSKHFRNSLMCQSPDIIGIEFSSLYYLPAAPSITSLDHREVWIEKEQQKYYSLWLEHFANFILTLLAP